MTQSVTKWWGVWGGTVIWIVSAISTAFMAYRALEQRIDSMHAEMNLRLQRIEIVLRIDPQTKDLPMRTVSERP